MRKVKYIPTEDYVSYNNLTIGKVYDVISYEFGIVTIKDDNNKRDFYPISMYSFDNVSTLEFIDVTQEYRNEVIDSILE